MTASELVAELGRMMGMTLTLEGGTAALRFDGETVLNLEEAEAGDALHLYVVLGGMPVDPPGRAAMCEAMLEANLFGAGSGGAAFAVDPVQGEAVLCRTLRGSEMTAGAAETAISGMLSAVAGFEVPAPIRMGLEVTPGEGMIVLR